MKTDLEKFKYFCACLGLNTKTYIKKHKVILAVYNNDSILNNFYFDFDGSLKY